MDALKIILIKKQLTEVKSAAKNACSAPINIVMGRIKI